jgi:hypothetical protein
MGVPTVAAAGANVVDYARGYDFEYTNGMPIRYVGFPFPVAGQPKSVHHSYVFERNDIVSDKPMMQAIIDNFTLPLTDNEKISGASPEAKPEPRLLPPGTEDALQQLFKDNDWTDYNPIILPTEARVAAMLKGTSLPPDKVVKTLNWPGGNREMTVEKVAVCAVMAGAKPEHFPLILAVSMSVPFGNSTSSMANMILVNGPIRNEIGMNYKLNVMGPHNEVNAVVGRAYTLLSKTAGNLHSGRTTFSGLGSNLQYNNLCIAENEEELPVGWDPNHVLRGAQLTDSVVTVATGWSYISSVGEVQRQYPPQYLIRDYMRSLTGTSATVIVTPEVAEILKDSQGFNTKSDLSAWLANNVKKTVSSYWGNGVVSTSNSSVALQGLEPHATTYRKLRTSPEELITTFQPGQVNVLVTGKGQTTWFVTDFRTGGRGTKVDDYR